MKEDFLHHVWQHTKFAATSLHTTSGESIQILNKGSYLQLSGPDFFNAQLIIGEQKWAGNIEIHLKSSDWYVHHHELDANYDSVILHVVWEYDVPIFRKDNSEIPTLELKNFVAPSNLQLYNSLLSQKSWIYCENDLRSVTPFVFKNWQERLYFERLERKATEIFGLLKASNNDWEAVFFWLLAKNFGLNTNGPIFLEMAQSIPFSVIRKEAAFGEHLEALFFGQVNFLEKDFQDSYPIALQKTYRFLQHKHQIKKRLFQNATFFKHRPNNFPTIRLAQLAALYQKEQNLFSKIMSANSINQMHTFFTIEVSAYWESHYNFDAISIQKQKKLTPSFMNLILINTVMPVRFAYEQSLYNEPSESILELMRSIPSEKNQIIEKFLEFGVSAASAFESQSLLQLKNEYCNAKRCLQCAVGLDLLKK